MKIKCDNGNIVNRHVYMSHDSTDSANWTQVNKTNIENIKRDTILIGNLQYQNNSNEVTNRHTQEILIADEIKYKEVNKEVGVLNQNLSNIKDDANVCNKQYRYNTQNIQILTSCTTPAQNNVEGDTKAYITFGENNIEDSNVSSNGTPVDEERAFDHSDSEEMFDNDSQPVPRGIVNPNYPGFQHLAHTLQDYSSNIEHFYHSENDMTDDDVDLEIAESSYEQETNKNDLTSRNINNNDSAGNVINSASHSDLTQIYLTRSSSRHSEIPDLLRTVSKNNNNYNDKLDFDITCSDADIENNFNTKDIIGDFNKEIEDEIKQLFNYNINIQDDLKELRQDIQETFAKPIENTINNISEVVNHVIKKLVETQCDTCECNASAREYKSEPYLISKEISDVNKENEQNTKTEMNLSRPTFLLLESNSNSKIRDAFLSDGKDEININYPDDYNTEFLSNNVENTIKQLSTELRKIIPKLDQMREHDKLLWPLSENNKKKPSITTDGNFNEVASSSQPTNIINSRHSIEICQNIEHSKVSSIEEGSRLLQKCDPNNPKSAHQDVKPLNISCSQRDHTKPSVHIEKTPEECDLESFDVYNIETALPKLDIDAIENHLRAAKEAERRKRNDREEIRKRLAMGTDSEEYYSMGHLDRPGKKPSLQSRLQNGKNLQICFMNETASDNESQASDLDKSADYSSTKSLSRSSIFSKSNFSLNSNPYHSRPLSVSITKHDKISTVQSGSKLRPTSLSLKPSKSKSAHSLGPIEVKESDFYALQATLQTEARIALAQAKEMARLQMECERRKRPVSPVTEMLQRSMSKASAPLAPDRRRVSRQLLTDMNIAQLQVIVNELHSQIESLNDTLVRLLMARDELHMGQDSMLVDIEDLTRYLGVKEQTKKTKGNPKSSAVRRLTSLVKK